MMAGGLGFEPRLTESESAVLPLDDPPREMFLLTKFSVDVKMETTGGRHKGRNSKHTEFSLGKDLDYLNRNRGLKNGFPIICFECPKGAKGTRKFIYREILPDSVCGCRLLFTIRIVFQKTIHRAITLLISEIQTEFKISSYKKTKAILPKKISPYFYLIFQNA
jgi:hypothetical protein